MSVVGRRVAFACAALLAAACAGPASPTPPASGPPATETSTSPGAPSPIVSPRASGAPRLALRQVATGLRAPLYVADAGDATGRLYVVEQGGRIVVTENGVLRAQPFLDLTDQVTSGGERGLLSVAFAPDYAQSGRLVVDYTDVNGDTVIERFQRSTDGSAADAASGRIILKVDQPYPNHNGGLVLFGPDGDLYVGMGDGGSAGDPQDNGQRGDTLLGKLLRIDVSGGPTYTIPADNPFVADPAVRPEIWALGLRNPWRFSFDRQTGDLWIGDVGQGTWEEIDFQPASSHGSENYGWRRMEGPDCYSGPCDPAAFAAPVAAYRHGQGDCAVIGGYVYRGAAYPELEGTYLYGDECSGRMWGLDAATGAARTAQSVLLLETRITLSSFGEDRAGELYVTDLSGGGVYQVVRAP